MSGRIRFAVAVALGVGIASGAYGQGGYWQMPPRVPPPPAYSSGFPSWRAKARLVTEWYRHYLRREPDPTGFNAWVSSLNLAYPQRTLAQVLGSDEYYRLAGNRDDLFIRTMFRDVLGRDPLPKDVRFWLRALDRTGNRARVALEFLDYTGSGNRY